MCALLVLGSLVGASTSLSADESRVLSAPPNDRRLGPLKDLDAYFPFRPPTSAEAWRHRADQVRRRVLVAVGLWPMPTKTPLNAVIHGEVERDGYTVEKVYFESVPGHFVSGNLYRPRGQTGKHPGILCPHGHWPNGRYHSHSVEESRKLFVQGAERFEIGGRYPLQSRCVQLVRMGCTVFHYDMLGYADSQQITLDVAHRLREARPEFETAEGWGFFSPQAELRLQSIMGVQTWNSVRALDFLASLPEVDATRVGVTGASGGGTQTFILGAVDPRPAASLPAVMVSTAMQGGCTCENACLLRIGTGNIELAGLFAPKPLGMTGADDWTREIATKGYPELRQLYQLLGVEDRVMAKALVHFGHNYNYVSRAVMYQFMNKHLQLGLSEPIVEEDFVPLNRDQLSVWNDQHPPPAGGAEHERQLTHWLAQDSEAKIADLIPSDPASFDRYRHIVGGAFDVIVGRKPPTAGAIQRTKVDEIDRDDIIVSKDVLRNIEFAEELPVLFLHPKSWGGQVVIWVDAAGKSAMLTPGGVPTEPVRDLLEAGLSVACADLLYTGEFLADGTPLTQSRKVKSNRAYAGFTMGYNHALFAQRVHDILTLCAFILHDEHAPKQVHLVGVHGAGPWVAAARAQLGGKVGRAAVDTQGFRFRNLKSYRDVNFLPGAVKYGDLPALLALASPHELWIAGENANVPPVVRAAYDAMSRPHAVTSVAVDSKDVTKAAVEWLLK